MPNWTIYFSKRVHERQQLDRPERFSPGDSVEINRTQVDPSLKIKAKDTKLDVSLEWASGGEQSFSRGSQRNQHDPSRRFQGLVRHLELGGVEVLVGMMGHRGDGDIGVDDDTEIFVATSPPDP